jgi:hypothetical protein
MIQNDEQLSHTRAAITDLEAAVASLKRDVLPVNPERFALMAEPALDQIRDLRSQVDDYVGISAAVAETATLWMKLEGDEIQPGDAPTSVVTKMLDVLRVGVQAVAEYLSRGAVGIRPTAQIKDACDLRITAWVPGSVKVGLRLPEIDPNLPPEVRDEAEKALHLYLHTATWVASQDDDTILETDIPDSTERRLLLNQVERLVPRPHGGIEYVELFGRKMPRGAVQLRRESRLRVRGAIERTLRQAKVALELVTEEGVLREIDLDQRTFIVRTPGQIPETRCAIDSDADDLLEIAKEGLDHRVRVVGNRQTHPTKRQSLPLQVHEIEILGEPSEEDIPK